LLPAKIPQQTKHNRAKNVIKLLEKMKKFCWTGSVKMLLSPLQTTQLILI
jgi:hypothetical protein